MIEKETGGPAFARPGAVFKGPNGQEMGNEASLGMTLRQYAAIKLRVPDSGIDWLDDMIRKSQRDYFAAKAMQGLAEELWDPTESAKDAYEHADEMPRAREAS